MENNKLELKEISKLFEYNFFIPSYQRGYRWTEYQVLQLLEDIWQFTETHNLSNQNFYCLQPLVVKQINDKKHNVFEVIDGQQRLTTLFLIIKHLQNLIRSEKNNFSSIQYETRKNSEEFLLNIETKENDKNENIDYWHMYVAYKTIDNWFEEKSKETGIISPEAFIINTILFKTKFIWYEVDNSANAIDIFSRLNIGKIPLTSAELIKALFLQNDDYLHNYDKIKQLQISYEWEDIDRKLQNDSFWYFIYNKKNKIKYETRIEYIFDLIKNRKFDSIENHTFIKYAEAFTNNDDITNIDELWKEIRNYFLVLEEWYNDFNLYHYIGFLINENEEIKNIHDLYLKYTKDEFEKQIKNLVKKRLDLTESQLLELTYKDSKIKKILLLFNILTIMASREKEIRFPFEKFKTESWDIEHVSSQTEKELKKEDKIAWAKDLVNYFNSIENNDFCDLLQEIIEGNEIDNFSELYKNISTYFNESDRIDEKHFISNLVLLDQKTNRSYGNAFFPIKRLRIIDNEKNGIFTPIATKNVFMKFYSKKVNEIQRWNKDDADSYLEEIKDKLKNFISEESNNE